MNEDLSVDQLYSVFARYSSRDLEPADANDCGDPKSAASSVSKTLLAHDLRSLTADDLCDYFYLAVEHIGTSEDFRHYLPRILELALVSNGKAFSGFASVLTSKLFAAGVATWPPPERAIINVFVAGHPQLFGHERERLLSLLALPSN